MQVIQQEQSSKRWRNERWIFWVACPAKMHAVGEQLRIGCRRALSSINRKGRLKNERGLISYRYQARREDCEPCAHKPACCPENRKRGRGLLRIEESAAVLTFRQKMKSEEAQASYRRRGRVAEFCNAWIKSKLGLRQFHVRGLLKVQTEMLWACLTYNLQHWIRLRKLATAAAS